MSRGEGEWRLGTCQVQVKRLEFRKHLLRRCRKKSYRDAGILTSATAAYALNKFLPVLVYSDQLEGILSLSNCSLSDLTQPSCGNYQKIFTIEKLICLHGWRRWKAALNVDPDMWWTVNILCAPRGVDELALFRDVIEDGGDEIPWSDGDIYRKFRFYEDQPSIAEEWKKKLSTCKQVALSRLKGSTYIRALDKLLVFPGLGAGLELGNVEKELALRSPYEISNNYDHIFEVWNYITLGDSRVRDAVDEKTVEALELRAPMCSADRQYICDAMRTNSVFQDIEELDLRRRVESRILDLQSIIPSIKTFHANMRFFGTGTSIIRRHVLGGKMKKGKSVFDSMKELWQNPAQCIIEYEEGQFVELACPANPRFAYEQVLVAAWRHFPGLSDERPKAERRKLNEISPAQGDPCCIHNFLHSVRSLGFSSPRIESIISDTNHTPELQKASYDDGSWETFNEDSPRRRCGRPYENSFRRSMSQLFLWRLYCLRNEADACYPTSLEIQRDIILPFFKRDTAEAALASLEKVRATVERTKADLPEVTNSTEFGQSEEASSLSLPYNNPSWPRDSDPPLTESIPDYLNTPSTLLAHTQEHGGPEASKIDTAPSLRDENSGKLSYTTLVNTSIRSWDGGQPSSARSLIGMISSATPTSRFPAVRPCSWDKSDRSSRSRSLIGVVSPEGYRAPCGEVFSRNRSGHSSPPRSLIGVVPSANVGDAFGRSAGSHDSFEKNSTWTLEASSPSSPADAYPTKLPDHTSPPLLGFTGRQIAFVDKPTLKLLTGGSMEGLAAEYY